MSHSRLFNELQQRVLTARLRAAMGDVYQPQMNVREATVVSGSQIALNGQRYQMDTAGLGLQPGQTVRVRNVDRLAAARFVPAEGYGGTGGGGGGGGGVAGITSVLAGPDIAVSAAGPVVTVARRGNGILLLNSNGLALLEYAATAVGLLAALAAGASGDVVQLPAGTFTDDFTQFAGKVKGMGRGTTILTGMVTGVDGSILEDLSIIRTANDATKLIGFLGPVSGDSYINDCEIVVTQLGAGTGYSIGVQAGNVYVQGGRLVGSTAGTDEV